MGRDEKTNTQRLEANPPGAVVRVHARQPLCANTCTHVLRLRGQPTRCALEVAADRLAHGCAVHVLSGRALSPVY